MLRILVNKFDGVETSFNEDTGENTSTETMIPARINVAAIRCYYARRDGKPGSRITFTDGGGFAVAETPEQLDALTAVH